jgi:hypothetical protein
VKRTSALTIALLLVFSASGAWIVEAMLVTSGRAAFVAPLTLGPALVLLATVLLLLAWPVRQAAHGKRRIDYRHATSVLGLAKASSLVGAIVAGAAIGGLAFFATRSVVVGETLLALSVVAAGAVVQLVAGLLAEHWCVLPPDDEETVPTASAPGPA